MIAISLPRQRLSAIKGLPRACRKRHKAPCCRLPIRMGSGSHFPRCPTKGCISFQPKKANMPTETIAYINPKNTCPAQGLYSHATEVPAGGRTLYIAGQLSVGLDGGVVGKNDFAAQMHQVLDNLSAVL